MRFGLLLFSILLIGGISIGTSYALTEIANDDVYIPATNKFFLDGGVDTYIHESSANTFEIVEGGNVISIPNISGPVTLAARQTSNFFTQPQSITATSQATLQLVDSTGSNAENIGRMNFKGDNSASSQVTYGDFIIRSQVFTAGEEDGQYLFRVRDNGALTNYLRLDGNAQSATFTNADIKMDSAKKLFLDGGGDTYISESTANNLEIFAGGNKKISLGTDICIGTCP
ncbi:MAG: hypothetical protein OEQ12_07125 [Nitrosopumilus sp.]|nr:hypothetical protein [Nitrosopumilus sp.]